MKGPETVYLVPSIGHPMEVKNKGKRAFASIPGEMSIEDLITAGYSPREVASESEELFPIVYASPLVSKDRAIELLIDPFDIPLSLVESRLIKDGYAGRMRRCGCDQHAVSTSLYLIRCAMDPNYTRFLGPHVPPGKGKWV